MSAAVTIAVPKGRILKPLAALLARAGIASDVLLADDRALIRVADHEGRFLLLKPDDVPTYVEYGAADLGVCGRDVLGEREGELYQPLDLGIGKCRMVVAAPAGTVFQIVFWPARDEGNAANVSSVRWRPSSVAIVPGCTAHARCPAARPRRSSSTANRMLAVFDWPYDANLS